MYETSQLSAADVAAVTRNNDGYGNGMFGNEWAWIVILLLFGWGRNGNWGGGNCGSNATCATPADVNAAVDQQTLISKIDQQTYGLADSFTALNNTLNNNFRGIDNAICTLGYQGAQHANNLSAQLADCCCGIKGEIKDVAYANAMNTNQLDRRISDCCCAAEKMNMQNRFDAQAYNCNTLQAIDKLGDRIIDYMSAEKTQALRDENFALRLSASQSAQNAYLINQLKEPCAVPAYVVPNPNCCYQPVSFNTCNNGCGGF